MTRPLAVCVEYMATGAIEAMKHTSAQPSARLRPEARQVEVERWFRCIEVHILFSKRPGLVIGWMIGCCGCLEGQTLGGEVRDGMRDKQASKQHNEIARPVQLGIMLE